jgi:IS30 family transposase
MGCSRLSESDRVRIEALFAAGVTQAAIAEQLGRARSTICRELARNRIYRFSRRGVRSGLLIDATNRDCYWWRYNASAAHKRSVRFSRRVPRPARLLVDDELRGEVAKGLDQRWSPRQVASRLRLDHPDRPEWQVSHETIYQALYLQSRGSLREVLTEQVALRSGRARRTKRPVGAGPVRSGRPWVQGFHISTRPAQAADRAVPGHWEGDLILGAYNRSAVITCVERSTRYVLLGALDHGKDSEQVVDVLSALISRLPTELRASLAWDNGAEMTEHARFTVATGCPVFFCDPHSPWQRGSNENTNGLLRQYLPKGTDLRAHTQDDLDAIARQLNGRPRETLGWATPAEKLDEVLVALAG